MCFFSRRFCPSTYPGTPHGAKNDDSASKCDSPFVRFYFALKPTSEMGFVGKLSYEDDETRPTIITKRPSTSVPEINAL